MVVRYAKGIGVDRGECLGFAESATPPPWANRVNDEARGETEAGSDARLARRTGRERNAGIFGVVAALLLGAGRATDQSLLVLLACVISAVPAVSAVALTVSRQRVLGMIFPSMRDHTPREASPKCAFPDSAGREAALAIIYGDFAKLDTLLHATPRPDLTARDELGNSLLGLATSMAIADGGSMRDIESLRLLLAAGARPRHRRRRYRLRTMFR